MPGRASHCLRLALVVGVVLALSNFMAPLVQSPANSLPGAFETSANVVNSFSNIFVYGLGLDYYTTYAAQVNAITAEQAPDVARRYLIPGRLVVIAVGDRAAIETDLRDLNLGEVEFRDAQGKPVS